MSQGTQKIGQRFLLGFHGPNVPDWLVDFSTQFELGGIILFDYSIETKSYDNNIHNPKQVKKLICEIKKLPGSPKVYVDQEGGKVRRFKEDRGFKPLVSHEQYALMPRSLRKEHLSCALSEMKELGIDVVLAPVIDVNYNPKSPDIGLYQRSFSSSIEHVMECAFEWFELARQNELELCLKHYPGLGAAKQNSHQKLTDLTGCYSQDQEELFFKLLPHVPGYHLLISHGIFSEWGSHLPLSISYQAYQRIFSHFAKAKIITDDMQMRGLLDVVGLEKACFLALKAGADKICIGNNLINQEAQMISLAQALLNQI